MLMIDFVGMVITICLVSLRYPHYALLAALANAIGQIVLAVFLDGNIDTIITAGAFSTSEVSNLSGLKNLLFTIGGPLTNFIISKVAGGIQFVSTSHLVNPTAVLKHPLAVINLRFAVISITLSICQWL